MRKNEKYIGVFVPNEISNALWKKKRATGITVSRQVLNALAMYCKVKIDYGTSSEKSGSLQEAQN